MSFVDSSFDDVVRLMREVVMLQHAASDLLECLKQVSRVPVEPLWRDAGRIVCEGPMGNQQTSVCVWAGSGTVHVFPDRWSECTRKVYLGLASCQSSREFVSTYVLSEWVEEAQVTVYESALGLLSEGVVESSENYSCWRYDCLFYVRFLLTVVRFLCDCKF